MTTIAIARPRDLFAATPLRRGFLMGFFGTLVVGLFLLVGLSVGMARAYDGRILPGVRVGGVELGGLDRAAAEARLRDSLPSLTAGTATVVVNGSPVTIPYAEIGRGYEIDGILDAALAVARSGSPLADGIDRLQALNHTSSIPLSVHPFDRAAIDRYVQEIAATFGRKPVDATVTYDPEAGFVVTTASHGARVEATALRSSLAAAVSRPDPADTLITISTRPVPPAVTTHDARVAAISAGLMTGTALQLQTDDDAAFTLEPAAIATLVAFAPAEGQPLAPVVDREALGAWLSELVPDVVREPKNASFSWDANGVSGVLPAVEGRALDVEASLAGVVDALRARGAGVAAPTAALAMTLTQPALSTAAAEAAASEMQRVSTWTTYYVPGEGNYWGANISIPAHDIDGQVVAPGEWFDFWRDIGPVTVERGYGQGGAIIGGRSVANGALAGGICSTSTTLFNAAMRAGLEIGSKQNHYYYIERYPVGLDATVFQTDTYTLTMSFRNDTPDPIVIRSYTGNGFIRFDLWGVPNGRTVSLSTPIITNRASARETTVSNPNLAPGTSRRVEYPHNGFDAQVTRVVRDADGNVVWENTWVSHYRPVNGITEVGPAAPPPPPSEEPEPTEPPPGD